MNVLVQKSKYDDDHVAEVQQLVAASITHYFEQRAALSVHELRLLMREGRMSLAIGLLFLALCQFIATFLVPPAGGWQTMAREGLTIMGWVAMWKPLDICLYRWWPVLALRNLYKRLSRMSVEVRATAAA